jgi:hypothetical protein
MEKQILRAILAIGEGNVEESRTMSRTGLN